MARTPEGAVKAQVIAILKSLDAWYFFPASGPFGRSGIPDVVGCLAGRFFAIECKANGNKATALQEREIEKIKIAGGFALVVDETNVGRLKAALELGVRESACRILMEGVDDE